MATRDKRIKAPIPRGGVSNRDILEMALNLASNRGEDTVVYRIDNLSPLVTFAIVCSAASEKRADALSEHAQDSLEEHGYKVGHVEGHRGSSWILVDAGTVVVHVFTREERDRIKLDDIYKKCRKTVITREAVTEYLNAFRED